MEKELVSKKHCQVLLGLSVLILFILSTSANALSCVVAQYYSQDGDIYYGFSHLKRENIKLIGVDSSKFTSINSSYGKDDRHVYYKGEMIKNADIESFQTYGGLRNISYDKNSFYIGNQRVHHEGDLANLEILDSVFFRDNEHIYYYGKKVKELDIESFKVLRWDAPYEPHKTWGWGCSPNPSYISEIADVYGSYTLKDLNKLYKDQWELYEGQ